MKTIFFTTVTLFILVCVTPPFHLSAQQRGQLKIDDAKPVRMVKVLKREGWDLPKGSDLSLLYRGSEQVDGFEIVSNMYKPASDIVTKLEDFFVNDDRSLIVNSRQVKLRQVVSYETSGRKFAYQIQYTPHIDSNGGPQVTYGALISRGFRDEDGDGTFETAYENLSMPKDPPAWLYPSKSD
jgi:hypothetical protein